MKNKPNALLQDLINQMELEQIEVNLFRGESRDIGSRAVFGGQVLGQSLRAAVKTVDENRLPHSMHAYFILPGDIKAPIIYDVDRIRDGGSFTTRRVIAIQHGRAIFNMSASFQIKEEGVEHQIEMPNVTPPEELPEDLERRKKIIDKVPERLKKIYLQQWPIDFRRVEQYSPFSSEKLAPVKHVWFRAVETLPDDPNLHRSLLAYTSDFNLLSTAMLPHGLSFASPNLLVASLDHALWFHCDFRMDEWLLYTMQSPNAANARGFSIGHIFNQQGKLVATVAQEGLMRLGKK